MNNFAFFKQIAAGLFLLLFALLHAQAADLVAQQIDEIGAHGGQTMYLTFKSTDLAASYQCLYGVLYCPASDLECKAMLAIALTAKSTASTVTASFNKDPATNVCVLTNIRMR